MFLSTLQIWLRGAVGSVGGLQWSIVALFGCQKLRQKDDVESARKRISTEQIEGEVPSDSLDHTLSGDTEQCETQPNEQARLRVVVYPNEGRQRSCRQQSASMQQTVGEEIKALVDRVEMSVTKQNR